jgi:hypothetical protein
VEVISGAPYVSSSKSLNRFSMKSVDLNLRDKFHFGQYWCIKISASQKAYLTENYM